MVKGKPFEQWELDEMYLEELFIFQDAELNKVPNENRLPIEKGWRAIVDKLPSPLKETISELNGTEELKMGLYAAITITGSLMPDVQINYAGKLNYPGLMAIIYYPPASGKGKLALLPRILSQINAELLSDNSDKLRKYEMEVDIYKKAIQKGVKAELPTKPSLRLIHVPGNITSSKLIEQLAENNGKEMVLLYETEMDSFGIMSNNGEHGKMNGTILRSAFHNEEISQMRKNKGEHLVVSKPKMATVLIGTPSQVGKIFANNQDGLLSRFLVVKGNIPLEWQDVRPCVSCVSLDEHFESLANAYYRIWKYLTGKKIEVVFTSKQWELINAFGKTKLLESAESVSENATSIAKRHANMIVRIAAIIAMVRYCNDKRQDRTVTCLDNDFEIASRMIEESYKSSIELFQELPGENSAIIKPDGKQQFYDELPKTFKLKDIMSISDKHNIKGRTLFRRLEEFEAKGMLYSPKRGDYVKLPELPAIDEQDSITYSNKENG